MTKRTRPQQEGTPTVTDAAALAGYAIAVATENRQHQIADRLAQAGARTVSVQTVRTLAQPVEATLKAATMACLTSPVDHLMVTSAVEFNVWMAAVRRWRLDIPLLARFAHARLLASNARCADSLRDLGFTEIWSTAEATAEGLVRHLRAQPLAGQTVAVQVNALAVHELCQALSAGGVEIVEVPTYQLLPSINPEAMRRLVNQIIRRHLHAVVLTSKAAADSLLWHAGAAGQLQGLLQALAKDVPAVCLGPLTAAPLVASGITVRTAAEPYPHELFQAVQAAVREKEQRLHVGGHRIEIRGEAVLLDGRLIAMQQGPIAVLRLLAQHPNRVMSPAELRQRLPFWAGADDHAIEMAVSRLRRSLEGVELIQTVIKRGYRLVET